MSSLSYVLDVDTGEDDALAILLACAYSLPIRAVYTSYGNTSIDNATANTAAMLALAGATHIPVIQGCAEPILPHPHAEAADGAGDFVGANGLCDVHLPPAVDVTIFQPGVAHLAEMLCQVCVAPTRVRYIVTGPCSNLAMILRQLGADAHNIIHDIIIMGSAIHGPGNSGPVDVDGTQRAEFNCYCDAVAFAEVLASGIPVTMVSWDVTSTLTIPYATVQRCRATSEVGAFVITLMQAFLTRYGLAHQRAFELNDPLTIWAVNGSRRYDTNAIRVVTESTHYGHTYLDDAGVMVQYLAPLTPTEKDEVIAHVLAHLGVAFSESSIQVE